MLRSAFRALMATLLWTVLVLPLAPRIAGAADTGVPAPRKDTTRRIPLLIIAMEYADCRLTFADADWNKKFFSLPAPEEESRRFDLFGYSGSSVNRYYREVACGNVQFEPVTETSGTPNDGVIRVRVDQQHPAADVSGMVQAVHRAVSMMAPYINFSKYDLDKNNDLSNKELVIVVISAGGERDPKTFSKNRYYHHRLSLGGLCKKGFVAVTERRDDLIAPYQSLAREAGVAAHYKDFPVSIGTLVHELGHVFGSPDLYNIGHLTAMSGGQKNSSTVPFPGTKIKYGRSTPCHYGAYTMVKAGFVEPVILEKTGVYTVNSAGTGRYNVFKIPTANPAEYFLIENRQFEGFDQTLSVNANNRPLKNAGIAIWHINEAFGSNVDLEKKLVDIEEASEGTLGYSHINKNRSRNACDPFYPLPGNREFSADSTPNNRSYGGEPQPWKITDFSASSPVMTFKFTRR